MPVNNPYQQYKKTQVDTADQGKLVVMLYDGAIRFINIALEEIEKKNIEKIHNNIIKAQDIIIELAVSLDMSAGDFSESLFSLYMYMNNRLVEANIKKENAPLIEVRGYLMELRDAWYKAAKTISSTDLKKKSESGGVNIAT